jgi:hypothetical protein
MSVTVIPCVLSEEETPKAYRKLTNAYDYKFQNGAVSVHEIHNLHYSPLGLPDEFDLEIKSKETIKNLWRNQKA